MGDAAVKLKAGSAVIYPTGLPHELTQVLSGVRSVVVPWMQGMIRDHEQRRLVSDLNTLARDLARTSPGSTEAGTARDLAATALRLTADV